MSNKYVNLKVGKSITLDMKLLQQLTEIANKKNYSFSKVVEELILRGLKG